MPKEDLSAPRPTEPAIERLRRHLRLITPLIALYDTVPSPDFEPLVEPKEHKLYLRVPPVGGLVLQAATPK